MAPQSRDLLLQLNPYLSLPSFKRPHDIGSRELAFVALRILMAVASFWALLVGQPNLQEYVSVPSMHNPSIFPEGIHEFAER